MFDHINLKKNPFMYKNPCPCSSGILKKISKQMSTYFAVYYLCLSLHQDICTLLTNALESSIEVAENSYK